MENNTPDNTPGDSYEELGYICESGTDEVLALNPPIIIDDKANADVALTKMYECDIQLAKIEAGADAAAAKYMLRAVKWQKRRAFLEKTFMEPIHLFAKAFLSNSTVKSIKMNSATLVFTPTGDNLEVIPGQDEAAILWLEARRDQAPDAVKTEKKVLISKIPSTLHDKLPAAIFRRTPSLEKFTVKFKKIDLS